MRKIYFLLSLIFFMSCHNKTNSTTAMSPNKQLENTRWKLVTLDNLTDSIHTLLKTPFMQLDSGKVKGFGGCNNYFGAYSSENKSIHFSGIASTKMFCLHGADVEDALFKAINAADHYQISNTRLELLKGAEVLAVFEVSAE
jgi:heat shock protein HslJ